MSIAQIKEMVLALSIEERADLAQSLWESLEAHPVSDEFLTELYKRDEQITSGEVKCSTHEEVMAKAKKALGC